MVRSTAQTQNDGIVKIYTVENTADPGDIPTPSPVLKELLRYHERTVGNQRYYQAMQAGARVDRVIRCLFRGNISPQDIAVLNDEEQYRIMLIQKPESVIPPVMDLTLERITQKYEFS
ncbi:MAG TPA: hypothetical protein DEP42_04940 [Ruminococcaceae bacterium]|nr:hypothetical protein [Oscillospiraceae bacterium]